MIDQLDNTLRKLLQHEINALLVDSVAISFEMPDNDFPPQGVALPAIDLFLYDVRESRELRSTEWQIDRNGDGAPKKKPAPVRVDCSYLITAWPSKAIRSSISDEHMLLGEVMRALLRHPTLPESVLQGALRNQDRPIPMTVLQPGQLQSMGEFWQAMGGKPKVALNLTVTIGVDAFEAVDVERLVTDKQIPGRREEG